MNRKQTIILLSMVMCISHSVFAQNRDPNNPLPEYVYRNEEKRSEMDAINGKDERRMIKQPPSVRTPNLRKPDGNREEEEEEKLKLLAEINEKFNVPDAYRNKYADFLKNKNTGIARMFPDKQCDKGITVTVEELERCANNPQVLGSGSRYSIRFREVPANLSIGYILSLFSLADMYFYNEKMIVGGRFNQSIISDVGDKDLERLDLKSDAFSFLKSFKPSETRRDLSIKKKDLEKGITLNGYTYSNSVSVKLNSTYVFRSITFSNPITSIPSWNTDVFVALKIVGKEDDGSIIFIWKKLKQKKSLYLAE